MGGKCQVLHNKHFLLPLPMKALDLIKFSFNISNRSSLLQQAIIFRLVAY
jgi:hypothetical protein